MGLLRWLKRDMDLSPCAGGNPYERSIRANKSTVTRNESYLRALLTFNKWRQIHLKTRRGRSKSANTTESDEHNLNSSTITYEEIDSIDSCNIECSIYNSLKELHNDDEEFATTENINISDDINAGFSTEIPMQKDDMISEEHIYAIAHQRSSEQKDNKIYDSPSFTLANNTNDDNFNYTKDSKVPEFGFSYYNADESEAGTRFSFSFSGIEDVNENVIVTDLDNTNNDLSLKENMETTSTVSNNSDYAIENASRIIDNFVDLMIYPFDAIALDETKHPINIHNGCIYHGEADSVDVSCQEMEEHAYDAFYNSFDTIRKLRHPNIALLMGISMQQDSTLRALIFEPFECSLYDRIHYQQSYIPLVTCHKYALQVANAVTYLHNREFIHSNICSQNIMISGVDGNIKLTGFELCILANRNFDRNESEMLSPIQNLFRNYLPLSSRYRKEHTKYFYQAPELLSNTKEYVKPTYQSDVYGVCITIWEMLNRAVPYVQFAFAELIKVFSLENAQLPVYEEDRYMPFKTLLEKGLRIQASNRFASMALLKHVLKQINISMENTANKQSNIVEFNESRIEVAGTLTSTAKKINNNLNPLEQNALERIDKFKHLEEFFSPIKCVEKRLACSADGNLDNSTNIRAQFLTDRNINAEVEHNDSGMSRKKYSVNIVIKSKNTTSQQSHPVKGDRSQNSNVRDKISQFESIINSTMSDNQYDYVDSSELVRTEEYSQQSGKIKCQIEMINNKNSLNDLNTSRKCTEQDELRFTNTEDIYIDDDFPSGFNLGANFRLNQNDI